MPQPIDRVPATTAGPTVSDPVIAAICTRFPARQESLLPLLHAVQAELGFIPAHAVAQIAAALNISVAEVHAVLQFYTYFQSEPPAALTIEICHAEACQAQQSLPLIEHIEQQLGCRVGQRTANGRIQLKKVYCLGLCTHGPVLQINEKPYVRLTPEYFDQLIDELQP